jgi:hypothetical protein
MAVDILSMEDNSLKAYVAGMRIYSRWRTIHQKIMLQGCGYQTDEEQYIKSLNCRVMEFGYPLELILQGYVMWIRISPRWRAIQ